VSSELSSNSRLATGNRLDDHWQLTIGPAIDRALQGSIQLRVLVGGRRLRATDRRHQHRRRDDRDSPLT
jgi:hypothetical protein